MLRIVALALLAAALHAQDHPAPKPPEKVDRALRERANRFFQDFVKGEFSDAETLVAPDSKNFFVGLPKEKYVSCEIKNIAYSGGFKLADVGAECARNIMFQGFIGHPIDTPIGSLWKLDHGKWVWYIDPKAPRTTPFGMMGTLVGPGGGGAPASAPPTLPSAADLASPNVALRKVTADKQTLSLKPGESGQIAFSNSAPGAMSVALYGAPPEGLAVSPARLDLQKGAKASVTVKALDGAAPTVLSFQVIPTFEVISVKVEIH